MTYKFIAHLFGKLVAYVKEILVEMECALLEEKIPVTVGEGSEVVPDDDVDDTDIGGLSGLDLDDELDFDSVEDESDDDLDEFD